VLKQRDYLANFIAEAQRPDYEFMMPELKSALPEL
jgi:hypothetical protein